MENERYYEAMHAIFLACESDEERHAVLEVCRCYLDRGIIDKETCKRFYNDHSYFLL